MALRDYKEQRRVRLAAIQVEHPVPTMDAARSPQTIEWCNQKLISGVSFDELRRMLGLGPAHADKRWRELRKHLLEQTLPESPDEALRLAYDEQTEAMAKMTEYLEELEAKIAEPCLTEEDRKAHHNYWKLKLDALKELCGDKKDRYEQYLKMVHAKAGPTKNIGISIQINNRIPRPSQEKDVTEQPEALEKTNILEIKGVE